MEMHGGRADMISVQNLTLSYGNEPVSENISFDIQNGEIFCLAGESGSGKSTVLKALMHDPKVRVLSGKVTLDGMDLLADKDRSFFGSSIGMIGQNPAEAFNPIRPFKAQFRETLTSHGMKYDPDLVMDTFVQLGLKKEMALLRRCPCEMSGGMNQRILIALIMMLNPKVLLCDEPTSSLDVVTQKLVIDELRAYQNQSHAAILLVTHNLGVAKALSMRTAVMKNGRIVESGETSAIFENPQSEYTRQLLRDVPRLPQDG